MSFLNPITLWAPLAIAGFAIPVIIHLLSRFRPKPMKWAAMDLLRRALVVRARRVRLEDILLMLLRAAALAAVAFALARPSISGSSAGWLGNSTVSALIAVDGSFSMAHQSGVTKSRFDDALHRAREILETLSTGDTVSLVLMGQRPRVILRNVAFDRERAEEALRSLEPLAEPLNLEACLDEIGRLAADAKATARECYLITDAQETTWGNTSEGVDAALVRLRETGTTFLVPAGPQNAENVAVTRLAISSGALRRGSMARFSADVRNLGRFDARNLSAKLLIDDVEVDRTVLDTISPGETRTLSFFAPFKQAGTFAVTTALEGNDPLPIDNRRSLVAEVRSRVRVLCVDGMPSSDRLGGESGILSLALSAQGRQADEAAAGKSSGVAVTVMPADDVRPGDLLAYDIVALAGVAELSQSQSVGVADFVSRGGGLMVFLGARTDRNAMNAMRGSDGTPLLPAELGEAVGAESRGAADPPNWNLAADAADHPVTDVLSRLPREQWAGIRFWRYVKTQPREEARVLLRLDPGNDPILVEGSLGRGKVYLFASSANREWSDLVVNPLYLMLVQQIATDLTRRPYEVPLTVGDALKFTAAADAAGSVEAVRDPLGDDLPVRVGDEGGIGVAVLANADLPGVYTWRGAGTADSGEDRPPEQRIAVNVDTVESTVSVLRDVELATVAEGKSLRLIGEKQSIRAAVTESRQGRELWRLLLGAALVALVGESILAGRFSQRMQHSAPGYTRQPSVL
jgi:hypothetical protein